MTQCVKCDQLAQCQRDMAKAELRARKAEADFKNLEQTKNAWQDKAMRLEARWQKMIEYTEKLNFSDAYEKADFELYLEKTQKEQG